ncbi:MAG TPA: sugar transferase [Rariglobus sp.]
MFNTTSTLNNRAAFLMPGTTGADTRNRFWRLFETAFIGDTLVILLALASSSWLRFETPISQVSIYSGSTLIGWTDYARHIGFGAVLFSFLLVSFRLYSLPRSFRFREVIAIIGKTTAVWMLAYVGLTSIFWREQDVSRLYVLISGAVVLTSLGGWRYLLHRIVTRAAVTGNLRQRVLFVGWSEQAMAFINMITSDRDSIYEVAGCVPSPQGRYLETPPARLRTLGDYQDIGELLLRDSIDIVIVADMGASNRDMVDLANLCEKELVEFKVIPSCFSVLLCGLNLETMSGVPVLGVSRLPLDNPFNLMVKGAIDLIGASVGLVLSAPIIAVFAALVYIESPGPIFYLQRRLGRYGRHFNIIKIRSMRVDAEADGKVGWSKKDDPRRLRIGAFMRRWNIDELPQFWNVLRGDMSLVGPRPERPELIQGFKEAIPHYNARHNIMPGITGWAQVKGFRGDTDLGERIRCDLHYIEQWSLLMDIRILLMTFLSRKNAC